MCLKFLTLKPNAKIQKSIFSDAFSRKCASQNNSLFSLYEKSQLTFLSDFVVKSSKCGRGAGVVLQQSSSSHSLLILLRLLKSLSLDTGLSEEGT